MEPLEYLPHSMELRTFYKFFRDRSPCTGVTKLVAEGTQVTAGTVLGRFTFTGHAPVDIVSPVDALVARWINADWGSMHRRPSEAIVLLAPHDEEVMRGDESPWFDIVERERP
jgi:hypothetical protein